VKRPKEKDFETMAQYFAAKARYQSIVTRRCTKLVLAGVVLCVVLWFCDLILGVI